MNTSMHEARAVKVWFDESNLWVLFTDGRTLAVPLAYFPRLLRATAEQRNNHVISGGGRAACIGMNWMRTLVCRIFYSGGR